MAENCLSTLRPFFKLRRYSSSPVTGTGWCVIV